MQDFKGKTAVITGGASGIGFGMAEVFAEEQMNIVLADIEASALEEAVARLESRQVSVKGVVTDTMRRESVANALAEATATFGNVHLLCNNAGVAGGQGLTWETPDEDWRWVLGVNFWGVLYGIQTFVPHMLEHGEAAHIVSTASLAGLIAGGGPYGVSKHGVLSLSEGLQRDLRLVGANIGASVLCPGFVNTNIMTSERNRPADLRAQREEGGQELGMAGLGALLANGKQPREIGEIVLASIEADEFYILPHPAWDDVVRGRVEAVLGRTRPQEIDFAEMMERRDAGEVF